jgi:hypothetical protein
MKNAYKSNRFRHSVTERPVVRIRFTDPDGRAQHCTFNSTWGVCGSEAFDDESDGTRPIRDSLATHITDFYRSIGCTVQGVEVVSIQVLDI